MDVEREYVRFKVSKTLEVIMSSSDSRVDYEKKNILERWLMNLYNYTENYDHPQSTRYADNKFVSELMEKKLASKREAESLLQKMKNELKRLDNLDVPNEVRVFKGQIEYKDFITPVTARIQYMMDLGGVNETTKAILRYQSILPRGQHWGIPWKAADFLHQLGFLNEGFASPFNSRFIDKRDGRYCSLFLDTDKYFCSLGNFFFVDFKKYDGFWMINPPYVDSILNSLLDRIKELSDENFFFLLPLWKDLALYQWLETHPRLLRKEELLRKTYYYEDPERNKIIAPIDSVYFIVGDDHERLNPQILNQLRDLWRP